MTHLSISFKPIAYAISSSPSHFCNFNEPSKGWLGSCFALATRRSVSPSFLASAAAFFFAFFSCSFLASSSNILKPSSELTSRCSEFSFLCLLVFAASQRLICRFTAFSSSDIMPMCAFISPFCFSSLRMYSQTSAPCTSFIGQEAHIGKGLI